MGDVMPSLGGADVGGRTSRIAGHPRAAPHIVTTSSGGAVTVGASLAARQTADPKFSRIAGGSSSRVATRSVGASLVVSCNNQQTRSMGPQGDNSSSSSGYTHCRQQQQQHT